MTKILFICPSQKQGHCGVGDYTRRLAIACGKQGAFSGIVALNEGAGETTECGDSDNARCWRLSSEMSWGERAVAVEKIVDQFHPDCVSVQFVPYGYHPRGLCWNLIKLLERAVRGPKKQIFFHELFLGLHREESFKNRMIGSAQRFLIRKLLREWNPDIVHSHADPYIAWLRRQHAHVKQLPLIGNIPVVIEPGPVNPAFDAWVAKRDRNPETVLLGGYFGTFYPGGADSRFVALLHRLASRAGCRIICFLAGRQNPEALARWGKLEDSSDEWVKWVNLGALPSPTVSRYLRALNFGIAATPWALAGKSGGIAAMREHGLPVLVPRNDWTPRLGVNESPQAGLIPAWQEDAVTRAVLQPQRPSSIDPASRLASQLLEDIGMASKSLSS